MEIIVRPATTDDVPELVQLVNSAYRGESSKAGWTTEADFLDGQRTDEEMLFGLLSADDNTLLVGVDGTARLIGCVYLQNKGTVMYLGMLTVLPTLQAKGLGKELMFAAENFAREKGCISIEMTVISIRHELIAWYAKRGYLPTGATRPFPLDSKFGIAKMPLEFIVLSKQL